MTRMSDHLTFRDVGPDAGVINMGIVGGGTYCLEILEKTTQEYGVQGVNARFCAVADPDPASPGMRLARDLGLTTLQDYRQLYEPHYAIRLIIVLSPDPRLLQRILATRPPHIRILSYHVFEIFWKAIGLEEHKWRTRTREMETILNGIQDFILVIQPDMTVVEVNEAFLTKMETTRDQVLGRPCWQVFGYTPGACRQQTPPCPLQTAIRQRRPCHQVRARPGRDGRPRYVEVDIYPIWEPVGAIAKFVHISRDVTQRLREEEEMTRRLEAMVAERTRQLEETHEKLLHQDKMASLGKLAASVVHEINNPIAGILNLSMLMERILAEERVGPGQAAQFRGYLELMQTETRRISRIVSNLLAFSRQSRMAPERLNVNALIEQTLVLTANLLKLNGVRPVCRLAADVPTLSGSPDQLLQVFMNLVSNAAEAMEATGGGELRIASRFEASSGHVIVRFADDGPGIAQKNFSNLFEPFFTTKKGKGVGLGLSVAYGIVQEHGGSIYVQSPAGGGAVFTVRLPAPV